MLGDDLVAVRQVIHFSPGDFVQQGLFANSPVHLALDCVHRFDRLPWHAALWQRSESRRTLLPQVAPASLGRSVRPRLLIKGAGFHVGFSVEFESGQAP